MGRLSALPSRLSAPRPKLERLPKLPTDPFYQSNEWRRLVAIRKLDPDFYAARRRAKPNERLILDHIVERKDGGADLDPENTQWLTMSEHQAKTAEARARRAVGAGAGGGRSKV